MRARPTPPDKKRLRDERDHVAHAEYPHGLRNHWSYKEACTHRAYRRAQHQRLELPLDRDVLEDGALDTLVRRTLRKWGADPLGKSVQRRLDRRRQRVAYNLFKRPYHRSLRERASRFFATITVERSLVAEEVRACVRAAFAVRPQDPWRSFSRLHEPRELRDWLDGFFRDDPTWAPRLRAWST